MGGFCRVNILGSPMQAEIRRGGGDWSKYLRECLQDLQQSFTPARIQPVDQFQLDDVVEVECNNCQWYEATIIECIEKTADCPSCYKVRYNKEIQLHDTILKTYGNKARFAEDEFFPDRIRHLGGNKL